MFKIIRLGLVNFANLLYKISHRIPVNQTIESSRVKPWFEINGDKTYRLNYNLDEYSVVFDLGGYKGEWASDIFGKYNCYIYIFEPVKPFADNISRRFEKNSKIKVFPFGLGGGDATTKLSVSADGSSIFKTDKNLVDIKLVDASFFINEYNAEHIDLMKINIEGAEYDLLDNLIKNDVVTKIKNIQIQFHDFVPNAEDRMSAIQKELGKTHHLTYQYKFVWENWQLNSV